MAKSKTGTWSIGRGIPSFIRSLLYTSLGCLTMKRLRYPILHNPSYLHLMLVLSSLLHETLRPIALTSIIVRKMKARIYIQVNHTVPLSSRRSFLSYSSWKSQLQPHPKCISKWMHFSRNVRLEINHRVIWRDTIEDPSPLLLCFLYRLQRSPRLLIYAFQSRRNTSVIEL